MAITSNQETSFGEVRNIYIRLNSLSASNHGVKSVALFRGFLSKEAFASGKNYVFEKEIELTLDVSQPAWVQSYAALKTLAEFLNSVDC